MNNFLADFKAKVGREDIFAPKIGNENLKEVNNNNNNGVRVANFATSKTLKSQMYNIPMS
jgi:hypothetical protein